MPARPPAFHPKLEALEARDNPSGGVLDTTFGSGGAATLANPGGKTIDYGLTRTAVQADRKVLVLTGVDRSSVSLKASQAALSRLNADGSIDTAFGSGGTVLLPAGKSNRPTDVALQPDGKILVASQSFTKNSFFGGATDSQFSIARLNANGTLDASFGGAGTGWWVYNPSSRDEAVQRLAVVPQGGSFSIYAGGGVVLANNNQAAAVVKLTAAGARATSFGSGGVATRDMGFQGGLLGHPYGALAVTTSGRVVTLNSSRVTIDSTTRNVPTLVAFTAAGQTDTGFNGSGKVTVSVPGSSAGSTGVVAIAAQGEGVVVAGAANFVVNNVVARAGALMRFTSMGALDATFATGGVYVAPYVIGSYQTNFVHMTVAADGSLVVAGAAQQKDADGTTRTGLLLGRFSADGAPDANFGPAPDGSGLVVHYDQLPAASSLSLDPTDGGIVLGVIQTSPYRANVRRFTGPS